MLVGVVKEEGDKFVRAIGLYFIPEKPVPTLVSSMDDFQVCEFLYDAAVKKKKIEVSIKKNGRIIAIKVKKEFYRTFKIKAVCEDELERLKKLSIAVEKKKCSLIVIRDEEGISLRFQQKKNQEIEALSHDFRQCQLSRFNCGVISDISLYDNIKKPEKVETTKQLHISGSFFISCNLIRFYYL